MHKCIYLLIIIAIFSLSACATPKQFAATGGSKSDGNITLSYEYGLFESPQVDMQQGFNIAKKRCEAWGYSNTEAFGGSTRHCISESSSGCNIWRVSMTFQCTGSK